MLTNLENEILEDAMVAAKFKFMIHRRKGGWTHKSMDVLIAELEREIVELKEAVKVGKKEPISSEGADIINYAAMIIDKAKRGM